MHIEFIGYEDRVNYISKELMKDKKLVFASYNETGNHWVLTAINTSSKKVYWLDSCHGEPSEVFIKFIKTAFERKRASNMLEQVMESDTDPTFIKITGCHRQLDDKQCGYYDCRFIYVGAY